MNRVIQLVLCVTVAVASVACFGYERKSSPAGPSATGVGTLMGTWTSANIIPTPSTCTDFKWNVNEQSTNSAKGSFSATCANELKLTGTAQGTLNGSAVQWSAQGNAAAPGLASCAISLTGTAEIGISTISVPYSGDTCLGKVSGVELLKRN